MQSSEGARERRLGSQAVVDRDANDAQKRTPAIQQPVVQVVGTNEVAAAVERDDRGKRTLRVDGAVYPHVYSRVARYHVLGAHDGVRETGNGRGRLTHGLYASSVEGRQIEGAEHRAQLGIEEAAHVHGCPAPSAPSAAAAPLMI